MAHTIAADNLEVWERIITSDAQATDVPRIFVGFCGGRLTAYTILSFDHAL